MFSSSSLSSSSVVGVRERTEEKIRRCSFSSFSSFPGEEIDGILAPVRDIRDRCKRDHGEIRRGDVFELLFIFLLFFFFALLLLLFCCSQEGGKRTREDEEDGFRGELDCFLGANFCQEKEKEKKKRRKSSDVIVILSNNNDEKTGNGDTTLRRRRSASQNTTIEILSSLETGDSQKKRLRVDDSDDDDDAKAFWNRRILTTPPMSPINKHPVLFSSNVNTPEKASESKSNAVVNKNDADTIRRGPTKHTQNRIPQKTTTTKVKITKRQRLKLQQKQEETDRARLDLLAIARKEEKKADDFARKSRVNCIKSKRLAKKKWSIYDSQRRRKRSLDAILATSNTLLFS